MVVAGILGLAIGATHYKGLAVCLSNMVLVDQSIRDQMIHAMKSKNMEGFIAIERQLSSIDRENTGKLRQFVKTFGWPTIDMVGKKGASDAWLIVQHADLNPGFQRECLDLMKPLVSHGQVDKRNYAYLVDRVLLAEGKAQIYGTQFEKGADGSWQPRKLEDPTHVDERRASMGMEPLAEYKKVLEQVYGTKPPGP